MHADKQQRLNTIKGYRTKYMWLSRRLIQLRDIELNTYAGGIQNKHNIMIPNMFPNIRDRIPNIVSQQE